MADRIRIDGDEEIARGLGRTIRDLDKLDDVSADVAERLRTEAARAAPKRTGRLAASGRVSRSGSASRVTFGSGSVDYAPPINFGTGARSGLRGPHNVRATGFFTNAVRNAAKESPKEYALEIDRSLDKITGA